MARVGAQRHKKKNTRSVKGPKKAKNQFIQVTLLYLLSFDPSTSTYNPILFFAVFKPFTRGPLEFSDRWSLTDGVISFRVYVGDSFMKPSGCG